VAFQENRVTTNRIRIAFQPYLGMIEPYPFGITATEQTLSHSRHF